jgi:hypothetical protein
LGLGNVSSPGTGTLNPRPSPPLLWCLLLEHNSGLETLGTGEHDLLLELEPLLLTHPLPLLWCLLLENIIGLGTLGTWEHYLLLELELLLLVHFLLFSGFFFWNIIAD